MPVYKIKVLGNGLSVKGAKKSIEFIKNMAIASMYEDIQIRTNECYFKDDSMYRKSDMGESAILNCIHLGFRYTLEDRLQVIGNTNHLDFSLIKTPKGCNVIATHIMDTPDTPDEKKEAMELHLWAIHIFEAIQSNYLSGLTIVDYLHYHMGQSVPKAEKFEMMGMGSDDYNAYDNLYIEHLKAKHHDIDGLCNRIGLDKGIIYGIQSSLSQPSARLNILNRKMNNTTREKAKYEYLDTLQRTIQMAIDYTEHCND